MAAAYFSAPTWKKGRNLRICTCIFPHERKINWTNFIFFSFLFQVCFLRRRRKEGEATHVAREKKGNVLFKLLRPHIISHTHGKARSSFGQFCLTFNSEASRKKETWVTRTVIKQVERRGKGKIFFCSETKKNRGNCGVCVWLDT